MKKVMMLVLVLVMAVSVMPAYAAKKAPSKGKPLSKSVDKNVAQAAADHIENWGKSCSKMKDQSLRDNKDELTRRRCM